MKAIMYHYVRPFDSAIPYLNHLHFEDFKLQLDYFENEFGFVKYDDFMQSLETGEPVEGVILTFDDGFYCHYDFVFKELKRRNLWGVFYIPTQPYVEDKLLDVHRTHLLLGKYNSKDIFLFLNKIINESLFDQEKINEFKEFTYARQQNDQYTLLVKRILNYFLAYDYREGILDQLMDHFIPEEKEILKSFYLKPDQIKEMHDAKMIIGSHTVNHPVMSRLNNQSQKIQITASFNYLENVVDSFHHKTFCYPYGGFHSFTDFTEKTLSEVGCLYSFNVEQRDISQKDLLERPQALPRYDCNGFKYGQVRKSQTG